MKKVLLNICLAAIFLSANAQENVYPAPAQSAPIYILNATLHIGNGTVLEKTNLKIIDGKIAEISKVMAVPLMISPNIIQADGKHVYPGLILPNTNLGLNEVPSVRATQDAQEIGDMNPNIRSIVAYNTDSKVINVLKANGILLANIVPNGNMVMGTSTVVQLDAWNWEDAAYKLDQGMHINLPSLINRPNPFAEFLGLPQSTESPVKRGLEQIEKLKAYFREAKNYTEGSSPKNLKLAAVQQVLQKKQKLFVHCDAVKEMLIAIDFAKEFAIDVVIVGGSDSYLIANLLQQNNIAVILGQSHSLPTLQDDDVDQPYKTAAALQKAGVLFAINDDDGNSRFRNLAFNAGTAAAYGLTKEEALAAITLNPAKILGIADKTGSLEVGKDANIVISEGDILDMKTSIITAAFIQGRRVSLDNKQKQLYERYKYKYGLKDGK